MMLLKTALKTVGRICEKVQSLPYARELSLYGSVVRGEKKVNDIDLYLQITNRGDIDVDVPMWDSRYSQRLYSKVRKDLGISPGNRVQIIIEPVPWDEYIETIPQTPSRLLDKTKSDIQSIKRSNMTQENKQKRLAKIIERAKKHTKFIGYKPKRTILFPR